MDKSNSADISSSRKSPPREIDIDAANTTSKARQDIEDFEDDVNEQSPLLPPGRALDDDDDKSISPLGDDEDWIDDQHKAKSSWYMFLLTLGGFGYVIGG
jgi:hypothetical protein